MTAAAQGGVRMASHRSAVVERLMTTDLLVPVGLFVIAVVVRLVALAQIPFPLTEGSAYYVAVARNLVTGQGLVVNAIWSYATPPLVLPRPAFELWQPMTSFLAAAFMSVLGHTYQAAQLGNALMGALVAPLAWLVGRDAARKLALPGPRAAAVAIGSGVIASILGPLVLASAVPDSTALFTVLGIVACIAMPVAVSGRRSAIVGLGVLLGLAYLTRMDAVYLGLAFVILAVWSGAGFRASLPRIAVVTLTAAAVALPWWVRNALVFGSPFPGHQLADNVLLTRNEQIFDYTHGPTLDGFLAQGVAGIAANIGAAAWHNVVAVLAVPAAPVAVAALVGLVVWTARHRLPGGALGALLLSGTITLVIAALVFPIATLWGTFEHAAGPLLVGLAVAAVIAGDGFVAWLGLHRGWQRNNAWLAPAALLALTFPLTAVQTVSAWQQDQAESRAMANIAGRVPQLLANAAVPDGTPLLTNHPIWLSEATGRSALALPWEAEQGPLQVASRFGARAAVLFAGDWWAPDEFSRPSVFYPLMPPCFDVLPFMAEGVQLFSIDLSCAP